MAPATSQDPAALNLSWLVRVRWFVWTAQGLLLLWATLGLDIRLYGAPLGVLMGLGFGSNVAVAAWQRRGAAPLRARCWASCSSTSSCTRRSSSCRAAPSTPSPRCTW